MRAFDIPFFPEDANPRVTLGPHVPSSLVATAQFVNYVRQYWKRDRLFLRTLVRALNLSAVASIQCAA